MACRVVAIIQARMASSRLPGKVLLDIAGQAMLGRVIPRTSRARGVDGVLVATTSDLSDDPVAAYCQGRSIAYIRGSQFDVLDRYYRAAQQAKADIVVRVTGDCPAVDPALIDEAVETLLSDPRGTAALPRSTLSRTNSRRLFIAATPSVLTSKCAHSGLWNGPGKRAMNRCTASMSCRTSTRA